MSKTTKLLRATLIVGLQVVACSSSEQQQMRPIGPNVKASFVFYFKGDVTSEQIRAFDKEVLSVPHPEGRGEYQAPGVQSTLLVSVPGHMGYAITFHANATREQRERLMAEVKASPLVYKVLEGVAPDDVKKID